MLDNKKNLTGHFVCDLKLDNYKCSGAKPSEWYVDLPEGSTIEPKKVS